MSENTLVFVLALFTLLAAFGFGVYQMMRVKQAKKHGETSAMGRPGPGAEPDRG